jgi:DNA-binding NtrC family response regulator
MRKHSVLVVEDDQSTRDYLSCFLGSRGYDVEVMDSGDRVVDRLKSIKRPSVVILDLVLPGLSGLEVLEQTRGLRPEVAVIVLSAIGQVGTVVKAMRLGASDYLMKPFEDQELESALQSALDSKPAAALSAPNLEPHPDGEAEIETDIASHNPKILQIRNISLQVADTDVPVLILGESGVGKEVLARFIHTHSGRQNEPFVKVNCAALPAELLESELFGYERGAFTGAMREKPGKFELAGSGTILLDEIAEMSPHLQAKLLHILQDGEFNRLGGVRPLRVSARILASTNKHLEQAVAKGDFREDLFYRLNVIKIEVPPLRERREDIPSLAQSFLNRYRAKYHRGALQLPEPMAAAFLRYSWPGNVRQLENVIRRYVIVPDVELALSELRDPVEPATAKKQAASLKEVAATASEEAEKELVIRTLQEVNWNRKEAARRLNICYKSLLNRLHRWQVDGRSPQRATADPGPLADGTSGAARRVKP